MSRAGGSEGLIVMIAYLGVCTVREVGKAHGKSLQ